MIDVECQAKYCPPIDSSLFSAIVLDYDISDPGSYEQICATLDEIKEGALAEEQTSFDPSGSSGAQQDVHNSEDSSDRARSWHGETTSSTSKTEESDLTSTSQDHERINLNPFLHDVTIERLSDHEKLAALKDMFPDIKPFDIQWILKKTHNNFGKAVEELLNQAFLEAEGENGAGLVTRGVDGLSESIYGHGRKKKKGRKPKPASEPFMDRTLDSGSSSSRWQRVQDDVDFIQQRTFIPREAILSKYHSCGASLSSTIAALIAPEQSNANPNITEDSSEILLECAFELAPEFPSLSYVQITGLVHLSHPSTASARELGQALVSSPSATASTIIPQYLPRPSSRNEDSIEPTTAIPVHLDPITAASLASKRNAAFAQAQSAYRKSKSNSHFGGAAAYYSEVGRDASLSLRKHEAAAADQIAASQSKPGEVDLHGLTSRDATRISRERVKNWWDSEAGEWSRTGKAKEEFRIVTGQGHHSAGGRGVLGPAVFKALLADGWKVRMEQGYIVISGKARK